MTHGFTTDTDTRCRDYVFGQAPQLPPPSIESIREMDPMLNRA
jgi:hypothetical protein